MRLANRFGHVNQIRRDRPLTHEELMHYVPSIFGEDRHTSRSERYAYIPTITVLESLQREGFQPFFACQTRVRDPGRRGYTKHMLRLRRVTSGSSARTDASVVSLWGKCVFRTGEMWWTESLKGLTRWWACLTG